MSEVLSPESLRREQLHFAQRAFVNAQELVRFMDQKAAFLLAAVALATSALVAVAITTMRSTGGPGPYLSSLAIFLALTYIFLSVVLIWGATSVFAAKGDSLSGTSGALGLLFPLKVLAKHQKDEAKYRLALTEASSEALLTDYAQQVMEISSIYAEKQRKVNMALSLFRVFIILWGAELLLLGAIGVR